MNRSNILSREQFIKIINKMMELSDFWDEVFTLYDKHYFEAPLVNDMTDELIMTLETMFNAPDNEDFGSDIAFFVYELNFGRDWEPTSITCNGEVVDLSSAEKLYDWLISQSEEGNEE